MTVSEAIEELKKLPPDLPLHMVMDRCFGSTEEVGTFTVTEDRFNLQTPYVLVEV